MSCFFFGCWNEAGHYLRAPGGSRISWEMEGFVTRFGSKEQRWHLDGSLAPRIYEGRYIWQAMYASLEAGRSAGSRSAEAPQGYFLRHVLDNGYSALQWWDRTQGDTRGACNSTILLEGTHTTAELLEALRQQFPTVLANLKRSGVALVEVFPGPVLTAVKQVERTTA